MLSTCSQWGGAQGPLPASIQLSSLVKVAQSTEIRDTCDSVFPFWREKQRSGRREETQTARQTQEQSKFSKQPTNEPIHTRTGHILAQSNNVCLSSIRSAEKL